MLSSDTDCRLCPRLHSHLLKVRQDYPEYHARPVPSFGEEQPRLLIVGLAPGMHGANATGRPFTGDHAGILLYKTLFDFDLSSQPVSTHLQDGLILNDCRITNAVRCLPPENKPTGDEIRTCNPFLQTELQRVSCGGLILTLGRIAHNAVLKALGLKQRDLPFGHNRLYELPDKRWLLNSYHCSRYNTQTRRLTEKMFADVFKTAVDLLKIEN
jgi:uracil-DNA glycosylase family 4